MKWPEIHAASCQCVLCEIERMPIKLTPHTATEEPLAIVRDKAEQTRITSPIALSLWIELQALLLSRKEKIGSFIERAIKNEIERLQNEYKHNQ